jgi:hypothetical protein
MIEGGCLCGGVRFRISGKLGPAGFCHCKQCQRASGSAFAANAPVRARYFALAAGEELVSEYESSPGKYRAFCRRCGSPVYSRRDSEPELPSCVGSASARSTAIPGGARSRTSG